MSYGGLLVKYENGWAVLACWSSVNVLELWWLASQVWKWMSCVGLLVKCECCWAREKTEVSSSPTGAAWRQLDLFQHRHFYTTTEFREEWQIEFRHFAKWSFVRQTFVRTFHKALRPNFGWQNFPKKTPGHSFAGTEITSNFLQPPFPSTQNEAFQWKRPS